MKQEKTEQVRWSSGQRRGGGGTERQENDKALFKLDSTCPSQITEGFLYMYVAYRPKGLEASALPAYSLEKDFKEEGVSLSAFGEERNSKEAIKERIEKSRLCIAEQCHYAGCKNMTCSLIALTIQISLSNQQCVIEWGKSLPEMLLGRRQSRN